MTVKNFKISEKLSTSKEKNFSTGISPVINLDFVNSKKLNCNANFLRNSTATYYDGYTSAKAEENLLLGSNDFTNYWSQQGVTFVQGATAPDGTSTAYTFTETAVNTGHQLGSQNLILSPNSTYIFSAFFKKGSGTNAPDWIQFGHGGVTSNASEFNLTTGAVSAGGYAYRQMTNIGNGWWRCSHAFTYTGGGSGTISFRIAFCNNAEGGGRSQVYTGDTNSDVLLWGAQVEIRSDIFSPTSYYETTTKAITIFQPKLLTAEPNKPRFDHNPVTKESLGLLNENSRTNLSLYSETFGTGWSANANMAVINNYAIAPDGTQTAILAYTTGSTGRHELYKNDTLSNASLTHTASFFAKQISDLRYIRCPVANGGSANLGYVDLQEGIAVWDGTNPGSAAITNAGNGWWRISFTFVPDSTNTGARANQFYMSPGNTSPLGIAVYTNVPGDVFRGILVWGFQMEVSYHRTSYIKTTNATATRSSEYHYMDLQNFSKWFKYDKSTYFSEATMRSDAFPTASNFHLFSVTKGSFYPQTYMRVGSSQTNSFGVNLTDRTGGGISGSVSLGQNMKGAFRVGQNDFTGYLNGQSLGSYTASSVPGDYSRISFGSNGNFSQPLESHLKRFKYYANLLSDEELKQLTES